MRKQSLVNSIFILFLSTILSSSLLGENSVKNGIQNKKRDASSNGKVSEKESKSSIYIDKIMSELSKEETIKLRELQKRDPSAFRQEIMKIIKKYKQTHFKRDTELHNFIRSYNAASAEEKVEIKKKITEIVRQQFNKKMELNRKSYERAKKKLQELEAKLLEREKNAELIIQNRVESLTRNPALNW